MMLQFPSPLLHKHPRQRAAALCLAAALLLFACGAPAPAAQSNPTESAPLPEATVQAEPASPTPEGSQAEPTAAVPDLSCTAPAALTPAMTEGPYYTPDAPERASLVEPGMQGTQLILSGYVLTADCQPVANALLDFWQADAAGVYDNTGYTLRGRLYTDGNGFYQLTTVVPGQYPGRTEHIHFKAQAPGGPELTSQLFFPGSSSNQADRIFDPALVITIVDEGETIQAAFNIVVQP